VARAAAAFAIAAVGLWLEPVAMTLFYGQINLVLLALVVGDLALPDHFTGKGIVIGLAARIKLTPLIFIPYLLFARRVRAAAVSALTFAVTVGLGFALLPHASAVFWGGQFFGPSKHFHLDNQSLNGVILRLSHAGPHAHAYWLVAAVAVGIAGLGDVKQKGRMLLIAGLCSSALIVCFALSRIFPLSLALLLGIGASGTAFGATNQTILQLEVPQWLRGRVMSLNAVTAIGMSQFGGFLVGAAATRLGTPAAVALGSIVVAVATSSIYAAQPGLRGYRSVRPPVLATSPAAARPAQSGGAPGN